jgi:hypothetical protein
MNMAPMKAIHLIKTAVLLSMLALAGSGCITETLWRDASHRPDRKPSATPEVRLFEGRKGKDFLVVYNERTDFRRTNYVRAYWLFHNRQQVERKQCPTFVHKASARALKPVPIFDNASELPRAESREKPYAVMSGPHAFRLCLANRPERVHQLPVYADHGGVVLCVALTPFALALDGLCLGISAAWHSETGDTDDTSHHLHVDKK